MPEPDAPLGASLLPTPCLHLGLVEFWTRFLTNRQSAKKRRFCLSVALWLPIVAGTVCAPAMETRARIETLRWTHPDPLSVDGFRIFMRETGQGYAAPSFDGYPTPVDGVYQVDFDVGNLDVYFVATAYNIFEESAFSNEIVRFVPEPLSGNAGAAALVALLAWTRWRGRRSEATRA